MQCKNCKGLWKLTLQQLFFKMGYTFLMFCKLQVATYPNSLDPIPNRWNLHNNEHTSVVDNAHHIVHTWIQILSMLNSKFQHDLKFEGAWEFTNSYLLTICNNEFVFNETNQVLPSICCLNNLLHNAHWMHLKS
jgi:hypothetical protein